MGEQTLAGRILAVVAMALTCEFAHSAPPTTPAHPMPGVDHRGDSFLIDLTTASHSSDCVPPALQRFVDQQSDRARRRLGLAQPRRGGAADGSIAGGPTLPLFSFFPNAGRTHHGDVVNGKFVDLDPAAGVGLDYLCRTVGLDTHGGIDCNVLTFTHQSIGVPVFAARDGTVVFAQDGFPDMNEFGSAQQGNIVAIDHGVVGGAHVETQYYHLKNSSVAVTVGQVVKAGTQIGMAASSGNSFGPHLHFQTMVDGQVYEPFAGPCRAGASGWTNQAALESNDMYLMDFGLTRTDFNLQTNPPWWGPWPILTDGQFSTTDPKILFYWEVWNFPVDCPYRVRFYRPNNSLAAEYFWNWGNAEVLQHIKGVSGFDLPPLGPVAGTWRIEFLLNNQLMMDAPFEMVAGAVDPSFNRPPEPISASFEPAIPTVNDVVVCRAGVAGNQARDDLDWDIVRYRYLWKINGGVIRDVTTAAQSDAIPHHRICGGATLTCTVTPNDGTVDGPSSIASVIVAGPRGPDINCDSHVNTDDLILLIGAWGPCPPAPSPCPADVNQSGAVNTDDLILLIGAWG